MTCMDLQACSTVQGQGKCDIRRATTKKETASREYTKSTTTIFDQPKNYNNEGSVCNVYRNKCNNKENGDEGILLYMIKVIMSISSSRRRYLIFLGKMCPCHAWLVDGFMDMDKDNE